MLPGRLPKADQKRGIFSTMQKSLSEGQRAYEAKRAAKAGMSLDKWLASKERQAQAEARAKQKAVEAVKPAKKPGLLSRLLERAHKPL
jgi:membrane-bound lytic murein transglycosylase MltF